MRMSEQRFLFRGENERVAGENIIERLYPITVPCDEKLTAFFVPDRKRKHSVEPADAFLAPPLIGVQDYFGVSAGTEPIAHSFKFRPQFTKIIDFTII